MAATLSQFLTDNLEPFLQTHKVPDYQLKALKSYRACRTQALGSHSQYCENGHLMGVWYNSCKRRGCPQCQAISNARWLSAQRQRLLAVTHHHWIFTLPHELLPLWRYNRALIQDVIFNSVAATLKLLSHDARYLNARPAYFLTLHTWGRNLSLHPHIHCLIAHGGLDHEGQWLTPKKSCLFPARVMMQLFRGKLLSALKQQAADLTMPADFSQRRFRSLLNKLGRVTWVVHCCKPYAHGHGVVTYLSRYVKSGPINNRQFHQLNDDSVSFAYNDHRTGKRKRQRLSVDHFMLRICDHIPQRGKPNNRYYGLYHGSCLKALNTAREQLGQGKVLTSEPICWFEYLRILGRIPLCEKCNAPLLTRSA